jgi:hypothetical protein
MSRSSLTKLIKSGDYQGLLCYIDNGGDMSGAVANWVNSFTAKNA